jgi:hypothetical protein
VKLIRLRGVPGSDTYDEIFINPDLVTSVAQYGGYDDNNAYVRMSDGIGRAVIGSMQKIRYLIETGQSDAMQG